MFSLKDYTGTPLSAQIIHIPNLILDLQNIIETTSIEIVSKSLNHSLDSLESVKIKLEDMKYRGEESGKLAVWIITHKDSGKAIGSIQIIPQNNDGEVIRELNGINNLRGKRFKVKF